ncbi:uncharacterized protein LTR77_008365 [Saxophila tyrrhenica]|uniref:Uncharacterized protein n=1 Tax=Saxophila tyrrhenica TaxID=1690608 RepID=A0AAV9P0N4_9PEZI|nr:hypothetical protein LTR77_008365 [Saxophila tyrrhenica]
MTPHEARVLNEWSRVKKLQAKLQAKLQELTTKSTKSNDAAEDHSDELNTNRMDEVAQVINKSGYPDGATWPKPSEKPLSRFEAATRALVWESNDMTANLVKFHAAFEAFLEVQPEDPVIKAKLASYVVPSMPKEAGTTTVRSTGGGVNSTSAVDATSEKNAGDDSAGGKASSERDTVAEENMTAAEWAAAGSRKTGGGDDSDDTDEYSDDEGETSDDGFTDWGERKWVMKR